MVLDRIAFIFGNTFLYWNSIILTISALAAISLFLAAYLSQGGRSTAAAVTIPVAMVLSIFLARLAHWYFQPDGYAGMAAALTDYTSGNYALMGVMLGCLLTAVLVRVVQLDNCLPAMLDAMCLGGCGGIAVGRLACFFSSADRGQIVENQTSLPWVYPVVNAVTGAPEYRLATFVLQAMAVGLIFVLLLLFFRFAKRGAGDLTLLFLLLYGMSQTILDSTRYDSLYMRSNGFISVEQLLGAVSMVTASVILSIRWVKSRGFRAWYPVLWLAMLASLGGAGYMEYYVQRHGDLAMFCYSVMTACLSLMIVLALVIFILQGSPLRRNADTDD